MMKQNCSYFFYVGPARKVWHVAQNAHCAQLSSQKEPEAHFTRRARRA
jgi:hypothetical protein